MCVTTFLANGVFNMKDDVKFTSSGNPSAGGIKSEGLEKGRYVVIERDSTFLEDSNQPE